MTDPLKDRLRSRFLHLRKLLPEAEQNAASFKIMKSILQLEEYKAAQHIAFYQAVNGEVHLTALWEHASTEGKYCYFPVIHQKKLLFLPATPTSPFKKNQFGIKEPAQPLKTALPLKLLDLVLMPLVAFDPLCTRIGMGAGYYDRTFAQEKPKFLLGVAYQLQCQKYIKPDAWDIPLDAVVTENMIYRNQLP